ncbi:Helix-turn-helix transcriptional regulator (plasmid) [Candidatus Trichorickettsia mobilis]|uniref:helix-turn-helix transcriptional regulator n=1 Tax=Candidatus Trichorickettsia mobilis TaxID=1346319 RepID=UPI002B25ACE7|nr:helix-turn-helix transcriptional regulator [Candidatus Trichorickettsia mobilis]WPY01810.1 Helix-turn-helix transcriptional regulator [Candidatus Trichorickettsia mobilis]
MHINGITFTVREVDIISCILNVRSTKKIAEILFIAPRTVETHIQNILLKIKGHSQEAIIDFIERSSEFKFIKNHYLDLLTQAILEKQLKYISFLANKYKISCSINCNKQNPTLLSLIRHLRIAGINVLANYKMDTSQELGCNYKLRVLSQKNGEQALIDDNQNIILLIMDDTINKFILERSLFRNIIDLSIKEKYFYNVFQILNSLLPEINCDKLFAEFEQLRFNIISTKVDTSHELFTTKTYFTENDIKQKQSVFSRIISNKIIILSIFIGFMVLAVIAIIANTIKQELTISDKNTQINHLEVITELDKFFDVIKNIDFSADNITKEQKYKNYSLVKQIERLLIQYNNNTGEIQINFKTGELLADQLIHYLSSLHSLSNYYTYNEHDKKKSYRILKYAQNLAEDYVISRSKIKFNFDKLDKEEVYTELAVVKDLPEIYTRIIYSLGRTHIYQWNKAEAIKYFELSQYLGNRLGLFEGYLSSRSGIGIVNGEEINIDIKNGAYQSAEIKLHELIQLYQNLKDSNVEYKANYTPGVLPSIIIPKEDIYNQVECDERIAKYYAELVVITKDINKKAEYLQRILGQFIGSESSSGILVQFTKLPKKKTASVYNNLGNILLQLYDRSVNYKQFIDRMAKELLYRMKMI